MVVPSCTGGKLVTRHKVQYQAKPRAVVQADQLGKLTGTG